MERRRFIVGVAAAASSSRAATVDSANRTLRVDSSDEAPGHFVGDLVVTLENGGHLITLVQPYEYDDVDGTKWPVPKGARSDGASIPQQFWSVIGGPLDGPYRNAAVVHDWYCDRRTRPWRDVHKMFYRAMLANGVSKEKARIMYAAVFKFGPKWDETTIYNNTLVADIEKSLRDKSKFSPSLSILRLEAITSAVRDLRSVAGDSSLTSWAEAKPNEQIVMASNRVGTASATSMSVTGRVRAYIDASGASDHVIFRIEEVARPTPKQVRAIIAWAPTQNSLRDIEAGVDKAVSHP